ncbi:MAG: hypothetical protein AB7G28_21120 [Pirellulales bacterium]
MKTTLRTAVLALLASLTLITFSTASADQPKALLMKPTLVPGQGCYELPKFGFSSFSINGYGERITNVRWGGLAQQMGLESGDVILRLNGYPLSYHGSWNDALREAMNQGGFVQLTVRDVRTGYIATRETYVGGYGPGVPHYYANGPITTKNKTMPHNHPQQLSGPEQIRQIVDLFGKKNNP